MSRISWPTFVYVMVLGMAFSACGITVTDWRWWVLVPLVCLYPIFPPILRREVQT